MSASDNSHRLPRRLHATTWIAAAAVIAALAYAQFPPRGAMPYVISSKHHTTDYGWPWWFLRRDVEYRRYQVVHDGYEVLPWRTLANLGVWGTLVAGTVVAAESWRRRRNPWQIGLSDLLALICVAAVMLAWWSHDRQRVAQIYDVFDREISSGHRLWLMRYSSTFPGAWLPWYVRAPTLGASGCAIYAACSLALRLLQRGFRWVRPRALRSDDATMPG